MTGQVDTLPRAAEPFVGFATLLRLHGFAVAPDQTIGFISAVGVLGPRHMADIRRAGHAIFAPPAERRAEFDALFRQHFQGQSIAAAAASSDEDDEIQVQDERDGSTDVPETGDVNEVGGEANSAEVLSLRVFEAMGEEEALRLFAREAPSRLARRLSGRRMADHTGPLWNMRRSLKEALRNDGEVMSIPRLRRKTKLRRVLLLIDVSGSMKAQTQSALRFAHALVHAAGETEVFTFGTRLTRITRALRIRDRPRALDTASILVADWDGGTRIGDALEAFLATPRFAGFVRGAAAIILSDGLERGEPDAMIRAVRRMSRLAWRIDWLTPLAADPDFAPKTRALQEILPLLSALGDGSRTQSICAHVLTMAEAA